MEFEFIKDAVKVEKESRGQFVPIIVDWLHSENKTLKFKCKNAKELKSVYTSANQYRKIHGKDYTIFTRPASCEIYLVRA